MKIVVIAGLDSSLVNFRGPLLRAFIELGHDVVCLAPQETAGIPEKLNSMGVRYAPVRISRASLNPFADVALLYRLCRLIKRERPDFVLSYTIKPVIYGSLAARLAGVPWIYALITGLGTAFHTPGNKGSLLRAIAVFLYRSALPRCSKVFAQNREIAELLAREKIVQSDRILVIPGSGVQIDHFRFSSMPKTPPVFLYLGRLLRDKGISELVAAARLVKRRIPDAQVLLVGDTDPNPSSFTDDEVASWRREGLVTCIGFQADVRPLLEACTAFVLPSYHEGMPRSVLEAMSTGRPVITTDTIGCKETILNAGAVDSEGIRTGDNGMLVPVREIEPLAAAMIKLASNSQLGERMGREGRRIAEELFDVRKVNARMMQAMNLGSTPHSCLPDGRVSI